MPTDVTVRVMRPDEWSAARATNVAAFDDPVIGQLLDLLRTSWCWEDELSFVAVDPATQDVLGHIVFSHAFVDAPDRIVDVLVLSPVGVRPDVHGTGVGTALITQALQVLAATRPEPLVFLEGSPRYYPRFGFEQGHLLGFTAPSVRIPPAAFQVYRLPSYSPAITGALVYPDAFWRLDAVGLRP